MRIRLALILALVLGASPALANATQLPADAAAPCHEDDARWSLGGGIDLTPDTMNSTSMGTRNFRFGVDRRLETDRWLTFDGYLQYASTAPPIEGIGAAGLTGFAGGVSMGMRYLVSLSYVDVSVFAGAGVSFTERQMNMEFNDVSTNTSTVGTASGAGFGLNEEEIAEFEGEVGAESDVSMSIDAPRYLGLDIVGGIDLEKMITDGIGLRLSTTVVGLSYYTQLGENTGEDYKALGVKLDSSLQLRFYF